MPGAALDRLSPRARTPLFCERLHAAAAGGFEHVPPEHLERADGCRAMLEQRAAELAALGLAGERNRDTRHALILAVLDT